MKNLVREIHRRSLWQVLGIYLAVSWIVLQVVDVVGNNFGLPDWVAPASLVLLLLGLPVVIATAFVQEGLTTKEPEAPAQSLADVGEVPPLATPEPTAGRKLFTWRNALVGGGGAFALLGVLTAAYLFMRSSGIGPAGTLVAQGVFEEGAKVVLAEFESPDPDLADVVTAALRIDLVQSPTIDVVPRSELAGGLVRMQRDENSPITAALARELAVREGYAAIIEGEVGTAGSGYVLTASISGGEGFEPLAAFRATARSDEDLIDAIEDLSRDIRDKAGESLRSVQGAPALRQVSTSSLEALRLYSRGEDEENIDALGTVELYEQAVAIDPEFAMAYRKIGVLLGNLGIRRDDQIGALQRAFQLRDRLPPAERYLAEAYYYNHVRGDRAAATRSYERLLEVNPNERAALNNLSVQYLEVGREAEAETLLERALQVESFTVAFSNLAAARLALRDAGAAYAVFDGANERLPEATMNVEYSRFLLTLDAADYSTSREVGAAFLERFPTPDGVQQHAMLMGMLDGVEGRHAAARNRLAAAEGGALFEAHPMRLANLRAALTLAEGDSLGAVTGLLEAYEAKRESLSAQDLDYGTWLPTLLEAGGLREAELIHAEWLELVPDTLLGATPRDQRRAVDARLAFARGNFEEAIRHWEGYVGECPGICRAEGSRALGEIYEATGDRGSAIEAYEQSLTQTTWRYMLDVGHRGPVLERLGQLLDEQGEPRRAAEYYRQFVDLWAEADEVLQPRVRAAQARLDAMAGTS
jgi:tetratricopeptide (TPR) repeat protein